jgi:hypothetical protein
MTPAAGTRLFFVGSEGVLFSEPRQELYAFNTTACVIWCYLEEGLSPPDIARALAAGSGLTEATARTHVDAALTDWASRGLFADGLPVPLAHSPPEPAIELPPLPIAGFVTVHRYRILGVTILVMEIVSFESGIGFYLNGAAAGFCARNEEVAPVAKGLIWTAVLRRQDYLVHIHAGVVSGRAGCVLLPAAPGAGKSTLTIALVHAGFDLLSDEVALLGEDLMVSPFPTAICVKQSGIDVVARHYPHIRELPVHLRGDGKHVVYLPPPLGRVPPDGTRRSVCGIVFPRYRQGTETMSRVLSPPEALARLLAQCLNVGRKLDHATVERLVRWISPLPCAEI